MPIISSTRMTTLRGLLLCVSSSDSGVKSETTVRRSTGFLPLSPAAFHASSSDSYALNRA